MTVTPGKCLHIFSRRSCFCNAPNTRRQCPSPFQFRTDFSVGGQSTFVTADELLHEFDVSRNSDVRTDRGRSVVPVELFFFSSRSTSSHFFRETRSTNVMSFSSEFHRKTLINSRWLFSLYRCLAIVIR